MVGSNPLDLDVASSDVRAKMVGFFMEMTDAVLDDFLSKLESTFSLTSEMDVGAFLGIDIIRNPDGFMELTQPGLIRKIIQACGLDAESKRHDTPALTTILRKDEHGAQREHAWKYRTLIGMLTYLSVSSRPDIAFAVRWETELVRRARWRKLGERNGLACGDSANGGEQNGLAGDDSTYERIAARRRRIRVRENCRRQLTSTSERIVELHDAIILETQPIVN